MAEDRDPIEVVDPEVLPPEDAPPADGPAIFRGLGIAFGPVAAGLLIDTVDFLTFGSLGILIGLLVGGSVAFWLASLYRMPIWKRFCLAILAGVYCTFPRTEFLPLATLLGALSRFVRSGAR